MFVRHQLATTRHQYGQSIDGFLQLLIIRGVEPAQQILQLERRHYEKVRAGSTPLIIGLASRGIWKMKIWM